MSMTDPISDMLTRIRNAMIAGHDSLEAPASGVKQLYKARIAGAPLPVVITAAAYGFGFVVLNRSTLTPPS